MTVTTLELQAAARIVRDALRDESYRSTPLGLEVARYIRWKRNEWGATPETIRDYEPILARLALFHADLELADLAPPIGVERLRECWDHYWGDLSPRTRSKVLSVWRDFFDWAIREGHAQYGNPARAMASPVHLTRPWRREHSDWFKPYAAGFYAWHFLGEEISRDEAMSRLDELLGLEDVQLELTPRTLGGQPKEGPVICDA